MAKAASMPKSLEAISRFYTITLLVQVGVVFHYFGFVAALIILYLEPPLIWRVVKMIWGQPEGVSYLGIKAKGGNSWWVAFHLQQIFNTFHLFEQFLTLFPGVYSAWLRLWGSEIGKKVNWTPESRMVDRTHLKIGDRALIGNHSYLAAHAIKKRGDKYLLYVKGVEVGADAVLAYRVTLAPGSYVAAGSFVEAGKAVYPNQVAGEDQGE
tara:strand:+ start:13851 stop:14480 length:630 start_codon:yes stop_codon:yes gene_type:complete